MKEEIFLQLALNLLPGIGNANTKQLVSYCGSAADVFSSTKGQLSKIPGIGSKIIQSILGKNSFDQAESILDQAEKKGIELLSYTDHSYPRHLKQILNSPCILFTKGKGSFNPDRSISIVGTRKATAYGKQVVDQIIKELSNSGITIFSGLAYGIDIAAHRQSLQCGLPTIGILAGGVDWIYPKIHTKTAMEMMESGGLLSEYLPGTQPDPRQFPARNRIIAGISDATIVVEAAKKGGALITANIAHTYNKPVFAVPGNLNSTYSEGCNELIRNQVSLIYTDVKDLLYHLNWDKALSQEKVSKLPENLSTEENSILQTLQQHHGILPIDELAWKTQVQINQLASSLLSLEFQGLVKSLPGKKYQLV
ncbi:MAG: DNA-processing protein DprA [Cyclobacteriaceae bacterium]|nr:DNA-processing protein DprA [Cyclobacteriaceae bacterium HetDA_MAG_MS6]